MSAGKASANTPISPGGNAKDKSFYLPAFYPETFVGRIEHLDKLHQWTAHPGMFLLRGEPGSGKSILALMFAWQAQEQNKFEAAVYQTCGRRSVETIAGDLADALREHLPQDVTSWPAEQKLRAVRHWLEQQRSLLVLDDLWLETAPATSSGSRLSSQDLLPGPSVTVVFTSRRASLPWVTAKHTLHVDAFTEAECETAFRQYLEPELVDRYRTGLLEFAGRMERLPIAVMVGADLLRRQWKPLDVAQRGLTLEKLHNEIHNVAGLFQRAIESQGESGQQLLAAAATCVPESFWLPLASRIAGLEPGGGEEVAAELVHSSLLQVSDAERQRFHLHSLLYEQLRQTALSHQTLQAKHAETLNQLFEQWEARWRECRECLAEIIPTVRYLHNRNPGDGGQLSYCGYSTARRIGELETALRIEQDEERLWNGAKDTRGKNHLQASYGNQAVILQLWGKLDEAMTLHKKQEELCEELGNKDGLQISYGNQALILQDWGKLDEAMALLKKKEELCEELGNKDGLQASYGNQAVILKVWGKLDEAMALLKKKEELCEELGNKSGLQASYGNQALILQDWGKLDEAMALLKKKEELCEELGNKDGLQASYGNQALILQDWGKLDEAMALHKKEEALCEELGNKDGLQASYGNQAVILKVWGKLDEAMALLKKQEALCEELGNKDSLQRSYGNQALILQDWGKLDEAMALLKKKEALCEELGNKSGLAHCYWSWGLLAGEMKDPEKEKAKLQAALLIFEELKMPRERDAVQEALNDAV